MLESVALRFSVASARLCDRYGALWGAVSCSMPITNLSALPHLLFKLSKDQEVEGYAP